MFEFITDSEERKQMFTHAYNAIEELKEDSLKNNPDKSSNDVDDCMFTGVDFFNKTGFVLSKYLDDYFKNFYKFCGPDCPEPTDSDETYRKFCQFVSESRNENFTSENPEGV